MRAKKRNTQPNAFRAGVSSLLLGYFILPPAALWANPSGEAVTHGSATFERNGNNLVITQGTDKLITKWGSFSIAQGERTQFIQPTKNSAALNRVVGGSRSIIDGELSANGKVILINPAGVTVGPTGVVNVNSFTASTQDITDQEFIGGGELLYKGASQETIENYGKVTAAGGDAIIISKHIKNHGDINAPKGTVALAAGTEVLVKPVGEERVSIRPGSQKGGTIEQSVAGRVQAAAAEIKAAGNPYALAINLDGLVDVKGAGAVKPRIKVQAEGGDIKIAQTGKLKARSQTGTGGTVEITAAPSLAAPNGFSSAPGNVNIAGVVDANGDTGAGGKIDITGGSLTLEADSLVSANGATTGGQVNLLTTGDLRLDGTVAALGETGDGGQIKMRAGSITLGETAIADASSSTGNGGRITVGGEFQGGIDPTGNAQTVNVAAGAQLKANAGTNGNGGSVIVWSEDATSFEGTISATGGSQSGNGGFAEISGKNTLWITGSADLTAANGELGTVLLDPTELNVVTTALTANDIAWATINGMGANVILSTYLAGAGTGDINVLNSGTWLGNGTLTFLAFRDININPGVVINAPSTLNNVASFDFRAGRNFTMTGATLATGNFSDGVNLTGGNINIQSGLNGGGNILITGSSLIARGGTVSGGNIVLEANNGNLTITNNATYADTRILAGGDRNNSGGQINGIIEGTTGDLTLRAMDGQISILQTADVNSRADLAKAGFDAKVLVVITPDFFTIGTKGGNLTLQTGASNPAFTLNRDITIDLLTGDVARIGGSNHTNTVKIDSGRDLVLNGAATSGKSLVGALALTTSGFRVDIDVDVARNLIMTQSAALRSATAASVMTIDIGNDLTMSGGTAQGFTFSIPNLATTGSYIGGRSTGVGSVLFMNIGRDLNMTDSSAIAWFSFQDINVTGDVNLNVNTMISNAGGTVNDSLLISLPGHALSKGGLYLDIGGKLTSVGSNRIESVLAGNVSIIANGDISFQGTATDEDKRSYIRTNNVNGFPVNPTAVSADVLVHSLTGKVSLDRTTVSASSPGSGNVGDITILASGAGNAGDVILKDTVFITASALPPLPGNDTRIKVISENGDVILSEVNKFTLRESFAAGSLPASSYDLVKGLLQVEARNGSILQTGLLGADVLNASFVAEDVTFNGRLDMVMRGGDLLIQSTVGDVNINPNSATTSQLQIFGYGTPTGGPGMRILSARDVIIQPTGGGDLLIGSPLPPFTTQTGRPVLIQADRNVVLGTNGSGSNVVIQSEQNTQVAGVDSISIRALSGTLTINDGLNNSTGSNRIRSTNGNDISLYGKNGINFVIGVPGTVGFSSVSALGGGNITLTSDTGDIRLGRLITDSGNINVSAGAIAGGSGSILDAYDSGPGRTMASVNQGNIKSTSGAVTLYARKSVGTNNAGANPINTTGDIKLELEAPANVSASSTGTGANDGVFLSAWKDLLIGTSGNTSVNALGDIILKSVGNVFINGNVVNNGVGRTVGIRSNSANTRNADFVTDQSNSGDIVIAGGITTSDGAVVLETGNGLLPGAVAALTTSLNDIQYNLDSTQSISTGAGEIYMRANRNISVGRLVTTSGNVTLIAGSATAFGANGRVTLDANGIPNVLAGKGQIKDVYQKELRDASDLAEGQQSGNIVVTNAIAGVTTVTLVGGKSVGLIANNLDIDLALHQDTTLKVYGKGTDSSVTATNSDGVFLSFLGDYNTNSTTAVVKSESNLGIGVTGNLTVAAGGSLSTANNGNIWLTSYGTYTSATAGAGFVTLDADVTAHGDGNINIFASRKVLVNSDITSTSGDISIIGAGRTNDPLVSEVYGVEVTSGATISTGTIGANVGTIHLAALASGDASGATLTTSATDGKILVGGIEVYGAGTATIPNGGSYYLGVTYGNEVIYDTEVGNPTGSVTVVSGSASTQDVAELTGATGSLPYIIDALGRIIITTSSTNTLTSTGAVDVSSVTVTGATTVVTGNGTSQAVSEAGTVNATLSGGTSGGETVFGTGYSFTLDASGTATVVNSSGSQNMSLTNTDGSFTVGTVNTSGTGTDVGVTTASGTAATIASGSVGTLGSTNYDGTNSSALIIAGQGSFTAGTSGSITANGTVNATLTDGTNDTIVGANTGLTASLNGSSNMTLTTTPTSNQATISSTATTGVSFTNSGGVTFDPNAVTNAVSIGGGTTTLGLVGGSAANLGSVNVTSTNATGATATLNLTTAYNGTELTTIAASGNSSAVTLNLTNTDIGGADNFNIDNGMVLNFGVGLTTTNAVSGGVTTTATYAGGFAGGNLAVTYNNVSAGTGGTAVVGAGNGLQSLVGSGATIDVAAGGGIVVDGSVAPLSTSNTPNVADPLYWAPVSGQPGVYQYIGTTLKIEGNVKLKSVAVEIGLNAAAVLDKTNPAANLGTLTYSAQDGYKISSVQITGSQTVGTVKALTGINVIGATVNVTGGSVKVNNFNATNVGYTNVQLGGAGYQLTSATASFANIGLSGTAATLTSSQSISATVASANVKVGGITTFAGTVRTNSGNTLTMNATSGSMVLDPGGSLVQMNGVQAPITGVNASSLKVADGAVVQTKGGDIYASGFKDAEIGTLDANGGAVNTGNIFLEATTGSVKSLNAGDPSKVNLIANEATVNAGRGLDGNTITAGAIGGTGADAIKLNVGSLNFSAGTGGANFRMDQGRVLDVAGQSAGTVAILNDHNIRVTETNKISFDEGTGVRLDNRFWIPEFLAATQLGINAGTQTVFLRATDDQGGGSIVSAKGGRVTGGDIYVDAETAIGVDASDRLLTNGTNLWFRAANGSAFISELNAVSVAGTALAAGSEIDIRTEQAGNMTIFQHGPAVHPIDNAAQPLISGLTANTDVTLDTFAGGVRVYRNITAQTGDVFITANSSSANPGNTTSYGVEIGQSGPTFNSVIQAGGAGNGQSVTIVSNFGDIWRTNLGFVRAQDVNFVTTGTGSIGWRGGNIANTNLLTQAENITFDSAQRVNIRNIPSASPAGFLWGNIVAAGTAAGDVFLQNDSGQLTIGQLSNPLGTLLTGIVTSGTGAANGYDITIDNLGTGLAGGSSTNVLIAEQISANRQANDPTAGDNAFILARTGSILRTGGADAIVTGDRIQLISGTAATNTIGTTGSRILTDGNEILFDSGSNAIITEEDATLLSGRTRNAGNIDVISNAAANNAVPATITVADLTSTAFGNHAATQYYGVNADTTGNINLEARGNQSDVVFEASARSGSGNINVAAGRDVLDAIAGDITDGLDSSSNLLNIVTGGNGGGTANVTIQAGRNIGDKGANTIDLAAGGRITTNSDGAAVGDGTYLSVLGDANIGNNAIITSDRNIDVSTFERTAVVNGLGTQEGDITVSTFMNTPNSGYTRLNASDDIVLGAGITRGFSGNQGDIVLQARTGGITRTATATLVADSLHIEAAEDVGVGGLGALNTNVNNLTFNVQEDLAISEANQLQVSGQSANGNITIFSTGSMTINDLSTYQAWSFSAVDDSINSAANPLQFAFVGGDSGIRANQTNGLITLGTNGGIVDGSSAENNNVTAYRAILNAATSIGSGLMGAAGDIETEVAFLEANAGSGTANIRELDSVTVGDSTVGTDFRINSGGFIYQEAGSVIAVGNEVELDTTRDVTIGHATVNSTGDLEIGDSEVLGDFTVTTTGNTTVTGVLKVAGNLALGIGSVDIDSNGNIVGGSFTSGGTFVVDGTGTITVYGGTNVSTIGTGITSANAPVLTYDSGTQTLKITATGSSQEFNLSVVLDNSGAFLNQYETVNGVTVNTVQVDLRGNTGTQLDNVIPIDDAIVWTGNNNSMDKLIVRTGPVSTAEIGGALKDYDLGQTGIVDLVGRDLNVNSARGANHGTGGTDPSDFGGSTINGGNGSIVNLDFNNRFGDVTIRDASTTTIRNDGDLNIDYINSYGNITASSTTGSVILNAGAPVNANGNNVTYQAAVNVQQQDATALTSGNRVTAITGTGSVGSALQRLQVDANEFAFDSGASVYVQDRFDDLTVAGTSTGLTDVLVSAADAELTVGTVGTQTGVTSGTNVILTADNQNITSAIDAANRVTLQANAAGRDINLGTETVGSLSLIQAELALISATTLQIGNGLAGAIALTSAIDVTGGVTNLRLWNDSTVQTNGTGTIAVENLAVSSNGTIDLFNGTDSSNDGNVVTNFAANSNGNDVDFKNNGALNVANVDGVNGLAATGSDIYLNTSGEITQSTGAIITTDGLELDTTRNASLGHASVNDATGDLNLGDSRVQGNYTVSTTGNLIVNGQLLVAGNLTLNGLTVTLVGTGHIVGGTSNVAGITGVATSNAAYSESGNVGTITATGAYATGADFDLAALLSNITLGAGVDTIVINLESTNTSYTLSLTQNAVTLNDQNQIASLQVRTGQVDNAVTTQDLDFNLVQTAGAVNLANKEVTINAAVGSNFGGSSALNGGNGSYVELANGANQFGEVHVNEAWNTRIHENGTLDLTNSEIHGNLSAQSVNGDLNVGNLDVDGTSRLVAVGANADVNFTGDVNFGDHAIVAAGEDILVNTGVTVTGQGAMTFIVDENAGKSAGDGWFRNLGTIQTFDADERIAIYAVSGPTYLSTHTKSRADQIVFGTIVNGSGTDLTAAMQNWKGVGGNTINDKFETSYQGGGAYHAPSWNDYDAGQGLFGSPVVWYKDLLTLIPIPVMERPTVNSPIFFDIQKDTVTTTDYGNFSDLERNPEEFDESYYTQKSFGIYYQRAAFREAAKAWAPDPVNILNGHFNDEEYFIQGKSNMRSYRSDRFHSEYVKYP